MIAGITAGCATTCFGTVCHTMCVILTLTFSLIFCITPVRVGSLGGCVRYSGYRAALLTDDVVLRSRVRRLWAGIW